MFSAEEKTLLKSFGVSEDTLKKVTAYQYALIQALGEIARDGGLDVAKIKARLYQGVNDRGESRGDDTGDGSSNPTVGSNL